MIRQTTYGALLLCLLCPAIALAQLTVSSPMTIAVNTPALFQNGTTLDANNHVTYTTLLSALRSLNVRSQTTTLSGPGGNTIPVGQVKVQVTQVTVNNVVQTGTFPQVQLTTTDQSIQPTGLNLGIAATVRYNIRYTLTGGANLLKPAGTYTATLTYSLLDLAGLLGAITGTTTLNINITNQAAIIVNNPTAALSFSLPSHYQLGRQLTHTNALQAFSNIPYSISVRASQALTSGSNTIPVNNVLITPTLPSPLGTISLTPVNLSTTNQTIVSSTTATLQQLFNISYTTAAGNLAFIGKPAGTYTTTLTYTITAP